jgi:CRISPR-associated protein Csm1
MSIQIFVEARITPREDFLRATGAEESVGRHIYLSLIGEIIPRALLDRLGLSHMLLGASSGSGFLLLLAEENKTAAQDFFQQAANGIALLSAGELELSWAITENLGEWPVVRKRLFEEMQRNRGTRARAGSFAPYEAAAQADSDYFANLAQSGEGATQVSVSLENPARFAFGAGEKTYTLGYQGDSVPWIAHLDLANLKKRRAAALKLAVDSLDIRLRRAQSVEDHLRLVHLYKSFFAGELQTLLLRLPDAAGKIAIVDSGMEGFTVYGEIELLLKVALEMHRVFQTMAEVGLRDDVGAEGKSLSCALAPGRMAEAVAEASEALRLAQAAGRDAFFAFGRVLDWEQVPDALEIRNLCLRMVSQHGASSQFVGDLSAFFRESAYQSLRRKTGRFEKPWRLYRRMSIALETERQTKDSEKTKRRLLAEFIGKNAGQARLRPAGRVGLELARVSLDA